MKWRPTILACSLIVPAFFAYGQNSVGIGVATPNKNAVLELISPTNNQGLLIPKLTTAQRTATAFTSALAAKENGLMVFDSDEKKFYYWDVNAWKAVGGSELLGGDGVTIVNNTISTIPQDIEVVGSTLTVTGNPDAVPVDLSAINIPQDLQLTGSTLTITNHPSATPINLSAFTGTNTDDQTLAYNGGTGVLSITRLTGGPQTVTIPTTTPPSGTASGDLSGNYPNPSVANNAINSAKIADGSVASADITDNSIVSGDINDGTIATADIGALQVTNAHIATGVAVAKLAPGANGQFLTTATGVAQWVAAPTATGAATGDLTGNYPNPTVANNAITSAKINDLTIVDADIAAAAGITVSKLGAGTLNHVLTSTAGGTAWAPAPAASGTAGGDLSGTFPNPQIAALTIVDGDIAAAAGITVSKLGAGTLNHVLTSTAGGTAWAPAPAASGTAGGDLSGTFPNPQIAALTIVDGDISTTANINVNKLLPSANNGYVLTTSGGTPTWAAPGASALIAAPGTRNLFAGAVMAGNGGGTDNVTYGYSAGPSSLAGSWNVFIGSQAAPTSALGNLNTIIGWAAGFDGSSVDYDGNTFVGAQSGENTTDGPNTFIGEKSGQFNVGGTHSVFIGNSAALANTIGFNNTVIGSLANTSAGNLNNATAIGYSAVVNASNKVRIGNTAITVIEGQVAFTNTSDRRRKENIRPIENGLDLIMKMKPMSYNMKNSIDARTNWGFIAQDIQELVGPDNAVVTTSGDEDKTLGLRYSDLIAPLVKAVQEQQDQITDLNSKLGESEKKVDFLIAEIEKLKKAVGLKAEVNK